MKKAYTVILETDDIDQLRNRPGPVLNLSDLLRRLIKKHIEENKK